MKYAVRSMFKSLTGSLRSKTRAPKKTRSTLLRMESLEERQLLSVTNPLDDAVAAGPVPAPYMTAVAEEAIAPIAFSLSTLEDAAPTSSSSSKGTTETFRTDTGGGLDWYTSSTITFTINIDENVQIDTSKQARLQLRVYDVDYNGSGNNGQPERDMVSVNGQDVGYLTGANGSWSACSFNIPGSVLRSGANTISIDVDTLSGGWLVECDWGELTVATVDSELTVDDVKLKCADKELSQEYALCGEKAELSATISASNDFTLDDYEISNITWTVERNDSETGEVEKLFKTTVSASKVQIEKTSASEWSISYDGWTPKAGDDGDCTITCEVEYKMKDGGENKKESAQGDGEVHCAYTILLGQCWLDANKNITVKEGEQAFNSDANAFKELAGVKDGRTTLTPEEYKEYKSKGTAKAKWEYLQSILATSQEADAKGKLPDFYLNFSDYRFYIVVGKGTKESIFEDGQVLDLGANDKNDEVVDYLYVPDAASFGDTDKEIEQLVRGPSYRKSDGGEWEKGDLVVFANEGSSEIVLTPYVVTESTNTVNEFEGMGLENCSSQGGKSFYLCRGSESNLVDWLWANTDVNGVGRNQYDAARSDIGSWLGRQKSGNVILAGHSLGGALAQWATADFAADGKISDLITFQAPGISWEAAQNFNAGSVDVRHYIANGDVVAFAGEAHLAGDVTICTFGEYPNGPFESDASSTLKHSTWLLNESLAAKQGGVNFRSESISSEELDSYWNHAYVALEPFALAFNRGIIENLRQDSKLIIGSAVTGVIVGGGSIVGGIVGGVTSYLLAKECNNDIKAANEWEFEKINQVLVGAGENPHFSYQGSVQIIAPNDLCFPGFLNYSTFGLNEVKVAYNESEPFDMDVGSFGFGNDFALYLVSADMTLSHIDELRNMNAAAEELPNVDYTLTGSSRLYFGGSDAATRKAEISASAFATASDDDSLICSADAFAIFYDSTQLGTLSQLTTFEMRDGVGNDIIGQADYAIDVYDKFDERREIKINSAQIVCEAGQFASKITIAGQTTSGEDFSFKYGDMPQLKIGKTKYVFDGQKFVGDVEFAPEPEPETPVSASTLDIFSAAESETSAYVEAVYGAWNGSKLTVKVAPTAQAIAEDAEISFFLDDDAEGFDGAWLADIPLSAATVDENGLYVFEFDFAGTEIPAGEYAVYCYELWEDAEQAVYSETFSANQTAANVVLSTSSVAFADTPVGQYATQEIVATNDGEAPARVTLGVEGAEFFVSGVDANGNQMESASFVLQAGESVTLTVYFVPGETGAKTGKLSLLKEDGETAFATVELSGTALDMAPTDLATSVDGAVVSASSVAVGDAFNVSCEVANLGEQFSDVATVTFYASQNADDLTSGVKLGTASVDYLAAGEKATAALSLTAFPELAAGNYYVGWVVETTNDSDASNNVAVWSSPLEVVALAKDTFVVDSEAAVDEDGDGYFDAIAFQGTATVATAGDYVFHFALQTADGTTIARVSQTFALVAGENEIAWNFDGNDIYRAGANGPYVATVGGFDATLETAAYALAQFEDAQATFNGVYSDRGVDLDGDGKFETLTLEVGVDVAAPGAYRVAGTLVDANGKFIAFDYPVAQELEAGQGTFALTFDAIDIVAAASDGPYTLTNLRLEDASGAILNILDDVYETQTVYAVDDFENDVRFTGQNGATANDLDKNGLYDNLTLQIGVQVQKDGAYTLRGSLVDVETNKITNISKTYDLTTESTTLEFVVDALTISANFFDGPYGVFGLQLIDADGATVAIGSSFRTDAYTALDFEHPTLTVADERSDSLDENLNSLNVVFKATSELGGYYNANARLVDANGDEICWAATTITLNAGEETEVTLSFDYAEILEHGVGGPFFVDGFSMYNLYDSSVYESVFINEFHETAPYAIVLNVPEWNLADYVGYDEFVLDATTDANVTATLYGKNADGELDVLKAWDFVGSEAVATIVGQTKVAESLTIAAGAASLLAEISFDGGDGRRDSVAIAGTDADDAFALGTEIVETTTPVYQNNPYEKLLQRYADIYGETSATYLRLKACYDAAYAQLQKCVVVKTATWGTVALENGAQIKFGGADDVAINAGAGNDSFDVNALNFAYTLVGGDGVDALDFSEAKGRLSVDMNATYRQCVVAGDSGTLRLVGDFESVVGTARNDVVIGDADGLKFVGNGGSDVVTLVGGENYVSLKDGAQSVVVRGGSAEIAIVDGDYSVVNVVGNKETRTTLNATGDHISLFGGLSAVSAQIVGDFASLYCGATSQTTTAIFGDYANVVTGAGADVVSVGGDRATIKTGAGDDQVLAQGAFANVDLGAGNDVAVIEDGDAEMTGENIVYGGVGNDFIFAANASGTNRFHAGVGNDVVVGSAGNDYLYADAGNNVLMGLAGADRLFGGSGRDALIASRTANTSDLEAKTRDEVIAWYAELYENWAVDEDLEATLETLGETSEADGAKDWLYRGGGKRNLIFASALDGDFENALERSPFEDESRLD
ncbi:MAG: DUF2974 domain-containing protein [Thermoguttaceae bacterium]|nr:DUF2974 domain-containing protein [Thermoguttaceae bacterium]